MNAPLHAGIDTVRQSRQLGLLLGAVLAVLAVVKGVYWLVLPALIFAVMGGVAPRLLNPLTRAWLKLGDLLARVMNPLVLGILWLLVFTPIGVMRQWFGTDPMRRKFDPGAQSYWIDQPERQRTLEDFKRQF